VIDWDPAILSVLACPKCHAAFLPPTPESILCSGCGLRFPIVDGIPVLLIDDALPKG
jgi:uncharacterized protein